MLRLAPTCLPSRTPSAWRNGDLTSGSPSDAFQWVRFPTPGIAEEPGFWPTDEQRRAASVKAMQPISRLPYSLKVRWLLGALASLERRHDALSRWDRTNLQDLSLWPLQSAISCTLWRRCRFEPDISYGDIQCRLLARREGPGVKGAIDGPTAHISVGVPFRWVTHVWARGLAVIDHQLLLDVDGPAESAALAVVVAKWETDQQGATQLVARPATAVWDGAEWHLAE